MDVGGETLAALMISIEPHTIELLRAAGHYAPGPLELVRSAALAA